jgi:hypothetical protein
MYHLLSQKLAQQQMPLTAENMLLLSLTNFDVPIGRGTIPYLCTKKSKESLTELLQEHSGKPFTSAEKNFIKQGVAGFIKKPELLNEAIYEIETKKLNKDNLNSNLQLYGNALAVAHVLNKYQKQKHAEQKAHEYSTHALEIFQDLMHIRQHQLSQLPNLGLLKTAFSQLYGCLKS